MQPGRLNTRESFVSGQRRSMVAGRGGNVSQVRPFHDQDDIPPHQHISTAEPVTSGITTSHNVAKTNKTSTVSDVKRSEHFIDVSLELEKTLTLPDKHVSRPWWSYLPQPIAAICFEHRIRQMLLLTHEESKAGLINELSTHILIDCLFLTITSAPIYSNELLLHTLFQQWLGIVFYCTFHVQLLSVLLHGVLIFALVEIPSSIFRLWAYPRIQVFLFVARVHTCGMYLFLICAMTWPVANYDNFHGFMCLIASLLPWTVALLCIGTTVHGGLFDVLNPWIKLELFPKSEKIRSIAEYDAEIFRLGNEDLQVSSAAQMEEEEQLHAEGSPSHQGHEDDGKDADEDDDDNDTHLEEVVEEATYDLESILDEVNLTSFLTILHKEKIEEVEMLLDLDHEDFRRLGFAIGQRVRLLKAVHSKLHISSPVVKKQSSKTSLNDRKHSTKKSKYNVHIIGRRVQASSGQSLLS